MKAAEKHRSLSLATLGPGILVAATGVGAGDLATATLCGTRLGTAVLWAVLVGAGLKFLLNEGLTRWQLATGSTLLAGAIRHMGRPMLWVFYSYLVVWSYLVAMALMSACGVAAYAIAPLTADPAHGKILYGVLHSLLAVGLVTWGGFRVFERVMSVCIGVMFGVVVVTAWVLRPSLSELVSGLLIPTIPRLDAGGLGWTIALLGGVGGTVTILCYGYWIREVGRLQFTELSACRLDLGVGYAMTAVFGVAMVIIGSQLGELDARGATLIIEVAEKLQSELGAAGAVAKWSFLIGAWGAVFSSLLGVWQSVPYLFADFWRLRQNHAAESDVSGGGAPLVPAAIDTRGWVYRGHLAALAVLPISGLVWFNFATAMKVNGIVGAVFIPLLAIALLYLCGRAKLIGAGRQNSLLTNGLLILTLLFFLVAGGWQIAESLGISRSALAPGFCGNRTLARAG